MILRRAMRVRCVLLLFVVAATQADELQRNTAMRSGPGAFFPVRERLKAGRQIEKGESSGNWVAVQTVVTNGWIPRIALTAPRSGIDYSGLLGAEQAVNVSSVDIAAATKGAFASSYSDRHGVNVALGKQMESIAASPSLVSMLMKRLTSAPAGWLYGRLPRPPSTTASFSVARPRPCLGRLWLLTLPRTGS